MLPKAILISIGDEILYGQTLDTNSHWISAQLTLIGIQVIRKLAVADKKKDILDTLREAEKQADLILLTGGLGPTSDDLTKPCLTEYFNTHLVRDKNALENIARIFKEKGREMSELNEKQADLPASCIAITNRIGTAPGMWFEKEQKIVISMPGVPYEMKQMMSDLILPKLQKKYVSGGIYHRMIRTVGIPESKLSERIKTWETSLSPAIKLAYLPTMGMVKLRLTAYGEDENELQRLMQEEIDKVLPSIEKYVYGYDEETLEEAVGKMLRKQNLTLSTAESCTGGFLSHKITSVSGSSQWFQGGLIAYSNQLKHTQLHVDKETLDAYGSVSESTVLAMAAHIRKLCQSDIGVSISGIAGPTGAVEGKPVGTVWIGYADSQHTFAKKFNFTKNRMLNIEYATTAALNMIRIKLK